MLGEELPEQLAISHDTFRSDTGLRWCHYFKALPFPVIDADQVMDSPTISPSASNPDGIPTHQKNPNAQVEQNDDASDAGDAQLISPSAIPGIFFAILVD
jgi:hypothetical protein